MIFALGALIARLLHIQVFNHSRYESVKLDQTSAKVPVKAVRGPILDRKGRVLAVSVPVWSLYADPSLVTADPTAFEYAAGTDPVVVVRELASAIGGDEGELLAKFRDRKKRFAWLKRHLTEREYEAVREMDSPLLGFRREMKRSYPSKTLACHVVGLTDVDGRGLGSVELAYDGRLAGTDGWIEYSRDAHRRLVALPDAKRADADPGQTLQLTIDTGIQAKVEEALAAGARRWDPVSISAIVLDPYTGYILALANYPVYDPNCPGDAPPDNLRNWAINTVFEPGSTFKPFVALAAFEYGVATPDTVFHCEYGVWLYHRRRITDCHGYGALSVRDIVVKSSNIGINKVGIKLYEYGRDELGRNLLWETAKAFGYGERTGLGLPGEERGKVTDPVDWNEIYSTTSVPMGYEIAVTPLQLALAYGALANGGELMRPILVRRILDTHGRVVEEFKPKVRRRVANERHVRTVAGILADVVEEGTGTRVKLADYEVAGKTGTAKKVENGRYVPGKYYSTFVGFAPAVGAEVVVLVTVNERRAGGSYFGGTIAGPIVREIMENALNYINAGGTCDISADTRGAR